MQRAGLSPLAVIRCATGASSESPCVPREVRAIKPGFLSRMIVTRHSPLEALRVSASIGSLFLTAKFSKPKESDSFAGL